MWDLPRPGLEPVSPALAGRFLTTVPPGKPWGFFLRVNLLLVHRVLIFRSSGWSNKEPSRLSCKVLLVGFFKVLYIFAITLCIDSFFFFFHGCIGSSFLCEGFLLVVASRGHSSSLCAGLSLSRPLLLRSTGSRHTGSVIVAHGPSCSVACGIFPDQGSNPCPLHWQADSQPLRHQGSPGFFLN